MAWYRAGGGGGSGVPAALKTAINDVLNKKFNTSTTYAPDTWPEEVNLLGKLPHGSAGGSVAHFVDGAEGVPVSGCAFEILPTVDGMASVRVVRLGKNFFGGSFQNKNIDTSVAAGETYDDMKVDSSNRATAVALTELLANTNYFVSCADGYQLIITYFDDMELYTGTSLSWTDVKTIPAGSAKYLGITFRRTDNAAITSADYDAVHVQVEIGTAPSSYAEYSYLYEQVMFDTYKYGAQVDALTGAGLETSICVTLDGTETISSNGVQSYGGIQIQLTPAVAKKYASSAATRNEGIVSDMFTSLAYPSGPLEISGRQNNGNLYLNMPATVTTVDQAKAWLSANRPKVTYTREVSIAFTALNTITFETLGGVNNFYMVANGELGNIYIDYYRDLTSALTQYNFRYLRLDLLAIRGTNNYVQMSMIRFVSDVIGAFPFPAATSAVANVGNRGDGPQNLVDGITTTKFCGNWSEHPGDVHIIFDLGPGGVDISVFDKFEWYTANDDNARDPITWTLYGYNNSFDMTELCGRVNYLPTTTRRALADTVQITPVPVPMI